MLRLILSVCGFLALVSPIHAQSLADERVTNDLVRNALRQEGDNGILPREVQHSAYPIRGGAISPAPYDRIALELRRNGFQVEQASRSGAVLKHVVAVDGSDFDRLTMSLRIYFSARGWKYDGWETFVIRKGN